MIKLKDIFTLICGSSGAQAITFFSSIYIARIYGPESIGYLSNYNAIIAILLPIVTLMLPMAIVLPKSSNRAINNFNASKKITLIMVALVTLFIPIYVYISGLYSNYLWFLPIGLYLSANIEIFTYWYLRNGFYREKASIVFIQSLTINLTKLSLGLYFPFGETLIISTVLSLLLSFFMMIKFSKLNNSKQNKNTNLKRHIYRYKDIVKYRCPQSIIVSLNQSIPIIGLTYFFSINEAGYFGLAKSVLMAPVLLIAKAINDVYMPSISKLIAKKINPWNDIKKAIIALSGIGIPVVLTFFIFGKDIFTYIFGHEWIQSGVYAGYFCIWMFFNFVNRPCVAAIPALNMERFLLKNSILNSLLAFSGLLLGALIFNNDTIAVLLFSVFSVVSQISIFFNVRKRLKSFK